MSLFRVFRPKHRALLVAAVLISAVLLGACGGSETPRGSGTPTTTPTTSNLPSNSSTSGAGTSPKPSTVQPTDKPSASVKPTPGETALGSSGTLDLKCARRGVDRQGITVKTKPGGPAGFNTMYSDGSSSVDGKSNYSGGFDAGFAASDGTWRSTWIVPANAPLGKAIVRAITQDGSFDLPYTVVAQNGTCPS
jgi:hypothetical protein